MLPVTSLWPPRSSFHSVFSVHRHSPQHNWQHTNNKQEVPLRNTTLKWYTRLNSPREAPAHKVRTSLSLAREQSVSALPPSTFLWQASEMRACAFSWCVSASLTSCRSATAAVRLQSCPRPPSQPLFPSPCYWPVGCLRSLPVSGEI